MQLIPNVVSYENWTTVLGEHIELPSKTIAGLQKRGHKLQGIVGGSFCQIILHDLHTHANMTEFDGQNLAKKNIVYGNLIAVSDPRKAGFPAGFWFRIWYPYENIFCFLFYMLSITWL